MNIAVKLSLSIHLSLLLTYGYGQTTAPDSTGNDPSPFINYTEMPEFRSGKIQTWVKRHLLYPPEAFEAGIEGKVFTQFTIQTDGSVRNIKIRRNTDSLFGQAAVELIRNMPLWKPAKFKGKNTPCTYNLPITFKLEEAILRVADEMPLFPEGDVQDWLTKQMKKMPDTLSLQPLASPTFVTFIIGKDGCVSSPEILRSCGDSARDMIAIRIVGDMPPWKPAKHRGAPVCILYILAVTVPGAQQ